MNIGIYISPSHAVPPDEKNILAPWMIVKQLTDGLTLRGHTVHIFCAQGSKTDGKEHSFGIEPTVRRKQRMTRAAYEQYVRLKEHMLFEHMIQTVHEKHIDLVHIHQPIESLSNDLIACGTSVPFVYTFHDPITSDRWEALELIQSRTRSYFVSVSDAQRRNVPFPFAGGTVYHGITLTDGMFEETVSEFGKFLYAGRIIPKKGAIDAITAVKRIHGTLMIVGQVYRHKPELALYFDEIIQPAIDNTHIFLEGVVKPDHMIGHYQTAKALLFPVKWEEPFGLVMVESMACGTPVIAYNRGSVPEIVKDGVTGFIIDPDDEPRPGKGTWIVKKQGIDGLVEAMARIGEIDRRACRKHVEEHFTIEHMITGYEMLYRKIIEEQLI